MEDFGYKKLDGEQNVIWNVNDDLLRVGYVPNLELDVPINYGSLQLLDMTIHDTDDNTAAAAADAVVSSCTRRHPALHTEQNGNKLCY